MLFFRQSGLSQHWIRSVLGIGSRMFRSCSKLDISSPSRASPQGIETAQFLTAALSCSDYWWTTGSDEFLKTPSSLCGNWLNCEYQPVSLFHSVHFSSHQTKLNNQSNGLQWKLKCLFENLYMLWWWWSFFLLIENIFSQPVSNLINYPRAKLYQRYTFLLSHSIIKLLFSAFYFNLNDQTLNTAVYYRLVIG